MIKILFVCLGNICRSPMAEFVMKDLVNKEGLKDKFYIESAATSYEAVGDGIHYGTIYELRQNNIPYTNHISRRIEREDYEKFDYIIGMEERNIRDLIKILGNDKDNKIRRLLDYSNNPRDISDPWYTGNFDTTYYDILEGCTCLLNKLK